VQQQKCPIKNSATNQNKIYADVSFHFVQIISIKNSIIFYLDVMASNHGKKEKEKETLG